MTMQHIIKETGAREENEGRIDDQDLTGRKDA